ncbi:MAG: hypothetical protein LBU77_03490, partial [Clostridiales bacterium]|nr:hypothetical protein [Clostridiales bacterium]
MATLWYGHFDSIAGDQRLLSAAQLAAWITAVMTSGIKNGGTNLQVTAGTGMSVNINVGMANVNGYQMLIKPDTDGSCYNVPLPASNTQYPTIYRIVARLDTDIAVRTVTPQVLISTGVANPAPPALTREDNGIWELSLAQIKVQANATTITNDNIIDERFRTDLCGIINSVFALDPSVWQARFDAFMDSITASGDE